MQRVELVGVWEAVLQPVPLHNGGLNQAGGRIRVVFEELDCGSVKCQVETSIERWWFTVPRRTDGGTCIVWNAHLGQPVLIENHVSGCHRQTLILGRCSLQTVNLG